MVKSKDKNHPAVLCLKDYQFRQKITREELAERAGIGYGTLQKLMSGEIPTDSTLRIIETNLGVRLLASYQMVAHPELGEYPQSWCADLLGRYVAIRQSRSLAEPEVINTFQVDFEWCHEKPGLKMGWVSPFDPRKVHLGYVSITSREGALSILSNRAGVVSITHLQRFDGRAERLLGIYCGPGQTGSPGEGRSIVAQVVAYVRPSELEFKFDNQVRPGAQGYGKLSKILSEINGPFAYIIPALTQ